MNKDIFACQAILPDNSIKTMSDKGINVTLHTQELTGEQFTALFKHKGKHGIFIFAPVETPIENIEIPETKLEFKDDKSPSKRLHDRMYVYYKKKHGTDTGFRVWYEETLDEIGNKYLDKVSMY